MDLSYVNQPIPRSITPQIAFTPIPESDAFSIVAKEGSTNLLTLAEQLGLHKACQKDITINPGLSDCAQAKGLDYDFEQHWMDGKTLSVRFLKTCEPFLQRRRLPEETRRCL